MESLTRGLRFRKSGLKPIQVTKRSAIRNQDGNDATEIDGTDNHSYLTSSGEEHPINNAIAYEKLPQTLLKHPRFSSLQVIDNTNGEMKWVPTNVNLHNHIIIPTIPQNLDSPDKFLEEYVYNLSKSSIDSSKPMWDLHLLHLKTSDAEAIGIFRIHHSLGDGTSLMSLLLACTRQISNPDLVPSVPSHKNGNAGWLNSSYNYYGSGVGGVWWQRWFMAICMVFLLVKNTIVDVVYFMVTVLFLKDTETPLKAPDGAEFSPRRFVYRTVSLDDMKLIKNAMNL
ncbi:O-acyltransferase WSD1-like protein, partial [Tanacetum coccineum]